MWSFYGHVSQRTDSYGNSQFCSKNSTSQTVSSLNSLHVAVFADVTHKQQLETATLNSSWMTASAAYMEVFGIYWTDRTEASDC